MRMIIPFVVGTLAVALTVVACGGDGAQSSPTASPTQTPHATRMRITPTPTWAPEIPTPTPVPTPSPVPTPAPTVPWDLQGYRLFYITGPQDNFWPHGELWTAKLDGSDPWRVSPLGEDVTYAGVLRDGAGDLLAFYVQEDTPSTASLWRLNTATGERTLVISFRVRDNRVGIAAVSPDGRYFAYIDDDSLKLLDPSSGEERLILKGNSAACDGPAPDIGKCFGYAIPYWSPDSRWVAVYKSYYEAARVFVVDPFDPAPTETAIGTGGGPWGAYLAYWSPSSDGICTFGQEGASALYVARQPNWGSLRFYGEYETDDPPTRDVTGCAWLDDETIFVLSAPAYGSPSAPELARLDLSSGTASVLPVTLESSKPWGEIVSVPGSPVVVVQFQAESGGPDRAQPQLVDSAGLTVTPVLHTGDWVVGLVPP